MITLDAVSYRIGAQHILKNLNLELKSGHFLVLVGPSGAGKTSLLRLIAGLEAPTQGSIFIDKQVASDASFGVALPSRKRGIGYVFQEFALWPHMSVELHLKWPLKLANTSEAVSAQRVDSLLDIVQLKHKREQFPDMLSGGEQQRLALARALVCHPKILLLDEPFANLDTHLRGELRQILRQLHEEHGTTSILVTHDQQEAMALADDIAIMIAGEIVQLDTTAEIIKKPSSTAVARFFGTPPGCLLPATYENGNYRCLGQNVTLDLPPGFTPELEFYYRPESLELKSYPQQAPCPATITEALPVAGHWQYRLQVQQHTLDLVSHCRISPQTENLGLELPSHPTTVFHQGKNLKRKKIVLVRHAMSEWNRQGRLQGQADPGLAPEADTQLQVLQEYLQHQTFARVETSPLLRARESADALGFEKALSVNGWKEIDIGDWQGQLIADLDSNQYHAWRAGKFTPDGGETWLCFCTRIEAELNRLIDEDGNSLVICHGGVIRAALQVLFHFDFNLAPVESIHTDYASAKTLWIEPRLALDL